jgi:DNA replication and repair protein RecF
LLATGESFKAEKIEEMVKWDSEVAHVGGSVELREKSEEQTILQVRLTRGEVQGKRVQKRAYTVNGVARRKSDFVGHLAAVCFRPEDIALLTGSPSARRSWMDLMLSQVDREYRRSLVSYEKGLRRRNKLLSLIREGEVRRTVLSFWDQLLIKEGTVLQRGREALVDYVNATARIEVRRKLVYDRSLITENRLAQYAEAEVAVGYTLVGPHRDDFKLQATSDKRQASRDLATYGSRGEQRMGVLWLKLAELAFVEERLGERPVLLLDDVFSELDDQHDGLVIDLLGRQQTLITTTEVDGRFEGLDAEIVELNQEIIAEDQ